MSSHVVYGAATGRYVETPLDWARCGTEAQAQAHRRRGQKPCPECLRAEGRARQHRRKATR